MTNLKQQAIDVLETLYTEAIITKDEYDLIAAALREGQDGRD